jgi:hypothetical protein
MDNQISEHIHIHVPIPEITQGKNSDDIGICPNTNRCIECGEIVPDSPGTETRWKEFILRQRLNNGT